MKGIQGISGSTLYALSFKDISVAVSDFTPSKYTLTKELAIDFARVIEELSQSVTLLPIRFGTFLKSDEMINQLLINHCDSFLNNLQKVENKYEFGLKVLWNYEKCSEEIRVKAESEEVKSDDYFSKSTIHTNYLLEKIKKHQLEDALLRHVEQLIEEISRHLAQINPDCKFKKMVTHSIILDAVFLVEKNKKDDFIQAIKELKQQQSDLNFLFTGPWPPYSFVEITID
jgi:glycosyltransferase involved in cell wall biosynthesis